MVAAKNGVPTFTNVRGQKQYLLYTVAGDSMESVAMTRTPDDLGHVEEIEIDESVAIIVEQIDEEITVSIASLVGVHFQVTADQALKLSRALAVAAENAANPVRRDDR
ncbi:hypothetical protein [Bradyrhizobium sp. AZCC 1708]|uniref:hypothetical protein n=1 Tax=Bradyrhizobium sp. AZCC 1708 TaxID=3117015 RepID=UPI002FEFBE86